MERLMEKPAALCYSDLPENTPSELSQDGYEEDFDEITARYKLRLFETANAMLFSPTQAGEAVEKALQSARNSLHEYKGESLLFTWICRHLIKYILTHYDISDHSADQ